MNLNWLKKKESKKKLQDIVCMFAMVSSMFAANSRCMCIYHDMEKPEALKSLRKF